MLALGIDIGGTDIKMGLVDEAGKVTALCRFPTEARGSDPQPVLDRIVTHAGQVMAQAGLPLIGIGVSTHGFIDDARRGPIVCQNTPALTGVDLKGLLENHFHLPTIVNNDLTAHMLAEYTYGSGRGVRRFLCMALGTGLGAGVMLNGQPVRLIGGKPGDTGRIIIEPDAEETCVYGVRGSAEALIGTPNIERLAQRAYGRAVPAHDVIAAARDGSDATAIAIMTQIGAYLGETLASLCSLFLPDRVALTGGTAEAGPVLLRACRQRFDELVGEFHDLIARTAGDYYGGVEIVLGTMRGETGVIGATVELFQQQTPR